MEKKGEAFDIPASVREKYGQKLVVYGSTQTHSIAKKVSPPHPLLSPSELSYPVNMVGMIPTLYSVKELTGQAAVILGLEFRAVPVSVTDDYGLRGDALRKVMQADQEAGYIPFFVGAFLPSVHYLTCSCVLTMGQWEQWERPRAVLSTL